MSRPPRRLRNVLDRPCRYRSQPNADAIDVQPEPLHRRDHLDAQAWWQFAAERAIRDGALGGESAARGKECCGAQPIAIGVLAAQLETPGAWPNQQPG